MISALDHDHGLFKRDCFLVNFFYSEAQIITLRILLYKGWGSVMHWFLRNETSNLVDWGAISRRHIGFTHARMRRIEIIFWFAQLRVISATQKRKTSPAESNNQLSVKIQKMYGKIEVEGYYHNYLGVSWMRVAQNLNLAK